MSGLTQTSLWRKLDCNMNANSEDLPDSPEVRELARLQTRMQRPGLEVNREGSFEIGWGIAMLCCGVVP